VDDVYFDRPYYLAPSAPAFVEQVDVLRLQAGEREHVEHAVHDAFEVLIRPGCKEETDTEAARVGQIDRHLAGGDYFGWASEPFDLRDQSQGRNELATAAEVAGGDGANQAGHGTPQRFGSREGQLVGAVQVACAQRGFADLQAFEDLALHRPSEPLDFLEPVPGARRPRA
jgi:hypothetical protein